MEKRWSSISFIFRDELLERIKNREIFLSPEDALIARGLFVPQTKEVFVSLNSLQWIIYNEQSLIDEIGKTLLHENVHLAIEHCIGYSLYEGEEKVVRNLAAQSSVLN